ncbi:hypothetical protein [Novosphingobium sp. Chol11]|uniref:hypothetical protein n=1 Tax=Novosphingobium sp. Chol11 TaxID=1385763 RepID=UPI0025D45559|nr:hypothetical protein [Novosphingobium sp. Chol11]
MELIQQTTRKARRPRTKPRRPISAKKPPGYIVDRRPNPFGDDWEAFVDRVRAAIQVSINPSPAEKVAPYDEPSSVLKRMVYEFVRDHKRKVKSIHVETAIEKFREAQEKLKSLEKQRLLRTAQKEFKSNSYYWILSGLSCAVYVGDFSIAKSNVTRFAKQLKYANRHKVPLEYLIGFLYQCGAIDEVCRKADDPDFREPWYVPKRES